MRKSKFLKIFSLLVWSMTDMVWGAQYDCAVGSPGFKMRTMGWGNIGKIFTLNVGKTVKNNVSKEKLKRFVGQQISDVVTSCLKELFFFNEIEFFSKILEKNSDFDAADNSLFEEQSKKIETPFLQEASFHTGQCEFLETFVVLKTDLNSGEEEKRDQVKNVFEDFILGALDKFRKHGMPFHKNSEYKLEMCIREVEDRISLSAVP